MFINVNEVSVDTIIKSIHRYKYCSFSIFRQHEDIPVFEGLYKGLSRYEYILQMNVVAYYESRPGIWVLVVENLDYDKWEKDKYI